VIIPNIAEKKINEMFGKTTMIQKAINLKNVMSDTIKKWHEMQEDQQEQAASFAYSSRPIKEDDTRKKAFTLLCNYDEEVVRLAVKILDGLK